MLASGLYDIEATVGQYEFNLFPGFLCHEQRVGGIERHAQFFFALHSENVANGLHGGLCGSGLAYAGGIFGGTGAEVFSIDGLVEHVDGDV